MNHDDITRETEDGVLGWFKNSTYGTYRMIRSHHDKVRDRDDSVWIRASVIELPEHE